LAATLAPLATVSQLLDVAGVLFVAAGSLRLACAARSETGPERLAGVTALVLGTALLLASGEGFWSLPVLFAVYLGIEAGLRVLQAVRHDNLRLYSAGIIAGLIGLGIWQDVFCGGFALFGPLIGLDLAVAAWAYDAVGETG
jgi:hypothetical protein